MLRQISHPDRIRLIQELQAGGQTVSALAASLDIPATRLSQHLAVLRTMGLVSVSSSGQTREYRLLHPELATWLIDGIDFVANRISQANRADIEQAKLLWRAQATAAAKG